VSKRGKLADSDDTTIIRPVQWECKKCIPRSAAVFRLTKMSMDLYPSG